MTLVFFIEFFKTEVKPLALFCVSKDLKERKIVYEKFFVKFSNHIFDVFVNGNKGTPNQSAYKEFIENETIQEKHITHYKMQFILKKI